MTASAPTTIAPTITEESGLVTQITTVLVRPRDQRRVVAGLVAQARNGLAGRPGFVSLSVHHSLDGERLLTYGQWTAADHPLADAMGSYPERGLALASDSHLFDVVYAHDVSPAGVTTISEGNGLATFINVIHTVPERQGPLLDFVIANDDAIFSPHPGFRSANFHRSRDGERVVNDSHWASEAAFLEAINAMMNVPGLTMAQANELAADAAGERGWTDFRFYAVDAVVTP